MEAGVETDPANSTFLVVFFPNDSHQPPSAFIRHPRASQSVHLPKLFWNATVEKRRRWNAACKKISQPPKLFWNVSGRKDCVRSESSKPSEARLERSWEEKMEL